jgi:hypothetical protein
MTPPYPIRSVDLIQQLDLLDPPYWGLWECTVILEDGRTIDGCTVQSDGYTMAYDTLRDEMDQPLDYIL